MAYFCAKSDPWRHEPDSSQTLSDGAECPTSPSADQLQRLPATKACPNGTAKQTDGNLWDHSFRLSYIQAPEVQVSA